ncbi:MAG: putative undecaprenyl-phosphate N-acetylglucosaminyl 1-phosphate transferase [Planctomycetes bacterium ADurb.Bin126]|nr:MAG: putative undecaprenyl-phosphate N-acetylglucosaminyl 1-phosphate transferase [Planctomycetes bacterium ADurb.Bin126]
MLLFALAFLGAAGVALVLTPAVTRLAHALKIVDRPGTRKVHSNSIPRIGGLAVVTAIVAAVLLLLVGPRGDLLTASYTAGRLAAFMGCCVFIFLVGLVDDIRGIRARTKLAAQTLAALIVCFMGIRIGPVGISGWFDVDLGVWSWPVTVLWIVGVTNAVNLIDGLDGLAAGISAIACAVIAVFALHSGQHLMAFLMVAALGSLTGFLFFNFNPAKIFLGDCGSMFLGFFIASASVLSATKSYTIIGLAMPALALGLPIFDTLFSMVRRMLERRSLFAPDRNHIHHRLIDLGFHQRHAVILMYVVTALAAGIGMFMMMVKDAGVLIVFACALLPVLLVFRIFGAIRFREALWALQRNRALASEARDDKKGFEEMQLRLRQARNFAQWWKAIRRAARELGFARLAIELQRRDGTRLCLHWRLPSREVAGADIMFVRFPVQQRRHDQDNGTAEAGIPINKRLESSGRRLALFARLLDEQGLSTLEEAKAERDKHPSPAALGEPVLDPSRTHVRA